MVRNPICRLPKVQIMTGLARSTVYDHIAQGLITKPVKLGARAVGWPEEEIQAILAARIAGKSELDIKRLVLSLMLKREGIE